MDYHQCMAVQEQEWFTSELEANTRALCTMRSFVPAQIADMSVEALQSHAGERGGLFSVELAAELKKNKCLHWIGECI